MGKNSEHLDIHLPEIKSAYLYSVTRGLILPLAKSGLKLLWAQARGRRVLYSGLVTVART